MSFKLNQKPENWQEDWQFFKRKNFTGCFGSYRELWEGIGRWEIQEEPKQGGVEEEQGGAKEEQGGSDWGGAGSSGVRGGAGQRGGAESWAREQISVCCHETPAHWVWQVTHISPSCACLCSGSRPSKAACPSCLSDWLSLSVSVGYLSLTQVVPVSPPSAPLHETEALHVCLDPVWRSQLSFLSG